MLNKVRSRPGELTEIWWREVTRMQEFSGQETVKTFEWQTCLNDRSASKGPLVPPGPQWRCQSGFVWWTQGTGQTG